MKDPIVIEREVKEMGEDVQKWKQQTKFKGYTSDAFQKLMEEKYSYLHEGSKTLFRNVINETIDENHYKYLLSMMRQVYESTKTLVWNDLRSAIEARKKATDSWDRDLSTGNVEL